ncbi:AsnC family transcriptional regulator [Tamaricihabitans halophyticus]|uniref:AsnC family transcriptional regulator n=1 Tax=Tamaricihabitans halophyticus TaxID=1262583 RepID=A0A4R2QEA2_9PSEU|nr:Lrp/AsnC family transcriptional regulator [Tamaricihabitans halophyticus]TCP47317.1 AsnC family transcriptional regulator [Tamaricihabitans halophyticus]
MSVDDALIAALRTDGRMSVADLAKRIGVARSTVATRLAQLTMDESLTVVAAVHPEFLGLTAYAHLAIRTSGRSRATTEAIAAMPAAAFVSAVSGEYQVAAELRLPDSAELYRTVAYIRGLPGVERVNSLVYVQVLKGLFMPGRPLPSWLRLDERDLAIMSRLQVDGRESFARIARHVGLSASAVRARVGYLVDNEVIRVGPVLSRARPEAGLLCGIGLNVRGSGDAVGTALAARDDVEFLAHTVGRFDIVATVSAPAASELDQTLEQIGDRPDVASTEVWLHLRLAKERYEWSLPTPAELAERR